MTGFPAWRKLGPAGKTKGFANISAICSTPVRGHSSLLCALETCMHALCLRNNLRRTRLDPDNLQGPLNRRPSRALPALHPANAQNFLYLFNFSSSSSQGIDVSDPDPAGGSEIPAQDAEDNHAFAVSVRPPPRGRADGRSGTA